MCELKFTADELAWELGRVHGVVDAHHVNFGGAAPDDVETVEFVVRGVDFAALLYEGSTQVLLTRVDGLDDCVGDRADMDAAQAAGSIVADALALVEKWGD